MPILAQDEAFAKNADSTGASGNVSSVSTKGSESTKSTESTEKAEQPEKIEKPEKIEQSEQSEKAEQSEKNEKPEQSEKHEKTDGAERTEKAESTKSSESDNLVSASILLVAASNVTPSLKEVVGELQGDMEEAGVVIREMTRDDLPANDKAWLDFVVEHTRGTPGVLGVFNWTCENDVYCRLQVVETRSLAVTTIPIGDSRVRVFKPGIRVDVEPVSSANLAAGIRETLFSELLFDLPKISRQLYRPRKTAFSQSGPLPKVEVKKPVSSSTPKIYEPSEQDRTAHLLWLEMGYIGDYPYPASRTMHGLSLGMTFFVHRHFAASLRGSAMARRRGASINRTVDAYHFPVTVVLQFPLNIGPVSFSLAPVVQWDFIWTVEKNIKEEKIDKFWADLSFGGETTWRIPMPQKGLDIFIGAGILATTRSEPYLIDSETIMPATTLQFYWLAGISKNLFVE